MASELDRLVDTLNRLIGSEPAEAGSPAVRRPADAITRELKADPRTTQVQSLADSPVLQAFRDELTNGLIRADTANRLLRLLGTVIERLIV